MPLRLLTPSFSKMRFKYVLTEEISIARRFEISLSVNPSPISCATALSLDDNNDDDNESSLLDKLRLERYCILYSKLIVLSFPEYTYITY